MTVYSLFKTRRLSDLSRSQTSPTVKKTKRKLHPKSNTKDATGN